MTAPDEDPFAAALAALLAPLARAMVARGVTIGEANEAMKRALLQAAVELDGDGVPDSRISARTGLHRKDVKRLRNTEGASEPRKSANAAAQTISYWATAPDFQGADGQPRMLMRSDLDGKPGFDDLVRRTRVDLAPGTVLNVLLDQGAVEAQKDGTYRLLTYALLPLAGSEAQVAAYQATLSAHLAAATHNLLAPPDASRHFDRVVRYSHLSQTSVDALTLTTNARAQALLEEINLMARDLQDDDAGPPATGKFAFGAFVLPTPPIDGDDS